jgi:hypothetical protein
MIVNRVIGGNDSLLERVGDDYGALERALRCTLSQSVEYDLSGERARDLT